MYAYLRPLYKEIRQEVNQDIGNEMIRADILIGEDVCIEVKHSRVNITEKGKEIKAERPLKKRSISSAKILPYTHNFMDSIIWNNRKV